FQSTARAESVTLTGGQVIMDLTRGEMRVDLTGEGGLIIHSVVDLPTRNPQRQSYETSTFGCACDGSGLVSFNGILVGAFNGNGSFTESIISGSVSLLGFDANHVREPPFPIRVDY